MTNFDDLAKGDIVKDAVVIKVDKLKGVYLKLNDARGYVPVSTLLFIITTRDSVNLEKNCVSLIFAF